MITGTATSTARRFAERFRELVLARPLLWAMVFALLVALPTTMHPFFADDHVHLVLCEAATGGGRRPVNAQRRYLLNRRDAFGMVSLYAFMDGTPEGHRASITTGVAPWWAVEGLRFNFWRPLSSHLELLDFVLLGPW